MFVRRARLSGDLRSPVLHEAGENMRKKVTRCRTDSRAHVLLAHDDLTLSS